MLSTAHSSEASNGGVRLGPGSVLVPFWSPLAITAPDQPHVPSHKPSDLDRAKVIKNPSRLNDKGLTKLASDQAFSVGLTGFEPATP